MVMKHCKHMKKLNLITYSILIACLLPACNKNFEVINTDPTQLSRGTMVYEYEFTAAQVYMSANSDGYENGAFQAIIAYKKIVSDYPSSDQRAAALDALKNLYVNNNQPSAYVQLLKDNNIATPDKNELDSVFYAAAETQFAARGPHARLHQMIDRDGAAKLVAMRQAIDEDVRTRLSAVIGRDIVEAGIAGAIARDVGRFELDAIARHHASDATRWASRRMKSSQRRTCSSAIHSFGRCACSIEPGPQMTVGMPAC